MCELFGASSIEKAEYKDLLREFYSHDVRNPHGWGIAVREGDRLLVKKEPVRASASEILAGIMERPIRTDLLLAHVRLATKGSIEYENTHPFVQKDVSGQTWTLIHNGTIFESSILDQYVNRQVGSTDSERILCHLIARMNSAAILSADFRKGLPKIRVYKSRQGELRRNPRWASCRYLSLIGSFSRL